jgi:hypothetical protein
MDSEENAMRNRGNDEAVGGEHGEGFDIGPNNEQIISPASYCYLFSVV